MVSEIKSHTALRGIAALLVVVFHFRTLLTPAFDLDDYTQFFAKGYLWVDCFFILSGFILCHVYGMRPGATKDECNRFLRARFARVYPLHFVTLVGLAAFTILIQLVSRRTLEPNWITFFLNLIDIHAWGFLSAYDWNFPSWSISVEFAAYLTFPLICIGLMNTPKITFCVMAVCIFIALSLGHENWERLALYHGLPMFFLGVILFYLPTVRQVALIQVVAVIWLLATLHFGWLDAMAACCFAAIVYSTRTDEGPLRAMISPPLLTLGAWSYSIYMLHIPVRIFYFQIFPKTGPVISFFILIVLTLAAGAISYRAFEMPMRRFLSPRNNIRQLSPAT